MVFWAIGASALLGSVIVGSIHRQGVTVASQCPERIEPAEALSIGIDAIFQVVAVTEYYFASSEANIDNYQTVECGGVADILAQNPASCTLIPYGSDDLAPTIRWIEENDFYGFVKATLKAYTRGVTLGSEPQYLNRVVAVTNCGAPIWYDVDDDYYQGLRVSFRDEFSTNSLIVNSVIRLDQ